VVRWVEMAVARSVVDDGTGAGAGSWRRLAI
jgi:hypothetical protein